MDRLTLAGHRIALHVRAVFLRMRALQLGHVAASLSFVSALALVPVFAIIFAVFTALPSFETTRLGLENYLAKNLMPQPIARQILDFLLQFSLKAKKISLVGGAFVLLTAVITLATIERSFGRIWGNARARPLSRRLVIYWSLISIGPVLLALVLWGGDGLSDWIKTMGLALHVNPRLLSASGTIFFVGLFLSSLYFLVPNQPVQARHALFGGLCAATAIEISRALFSYYIVQSTTYTAIYGALAAIPILLVWLNIFWLIVLFGAIVTAYLPNRAYVEQSALTRQNRFYLACDTLALLTRARLHQSNALVLQSTLEQQLAVPPQHIESVLTELAQLHWVQLNLAVEKKKLWRQRSVRSWSLLVHPDHLLLSDLYHAMAPMDQPHRLSQALDLALTSSLSQTLRQWSEQGVAHQ